MSSEVYRILDANLNRSREALRVIEEYVRFVRDDAKLAGRLKRLRHRLNSVVDALDANLLLAARASQSDVGKDIPSPSQRAKTDPKAVAVASCKRFQEAMRSIEEYAAGVDVSVSELAAGLRFDGYRLEKELMLAIDPAGAFEEVTLYVLIGSDLCPVENIVPLSCDLLEAGVDCLQLREKRLPDKETFELARKLSDACRSRNKLFIVNDRSDIAKAVGAHGVHLGQDDLPVHVVRSILPDAIIGLSTHNPGQVEQAIREQPTYVAIGPAFETQTKPHEPVAGIDFIRGAIETLDRAGIAHVAIGGIGPDNIAPLLAAGVKRIAVSSAVLKSDNPASTARLLLQHMT